MTKLKKESELCDRFAEMATVQGWAVYPETSGFDLVLVWNSEPVNVGRFNEVRTGDQVGVEAKLLGNVKVLYQVLKRVEHSGNNPNFVATLLPKTSYEFSWLAKKLGVATFAIEMPRVRGYRGMFRSFRSRICDSLPTRRDPAKKLWLPPVVPRGSGGVPCPSSLTQWRVKALRLCNRLKSNGAVTSRDFKEFGLSSQIWIKSGWLIRLPEKIDGLYSYVANTKSILPDVGFEEEAREIARNDLSEQIRSRQKSTS